MNKTRHNSTATNQSTPCPTYPYMRHGHRVFGLAGWKNSGKTTLVTRIIAAISARGFKVSSVKHAHHQCDIDKPGTDSFRHREAGAGEVALIAAGTRWAIMHECAEGEREILLDDVLARLGPCDLVLVEGFKTEPFPKIEVRRADAKKQDPLCPSDYQIVALACDAPDDLVETADLSLFHLDDIEQIADFILAYVGLNKEDAGHG
jgi:molybdopterin-guanine dinucleotide biosynthesis adapter protein